MTRYITIEAGAAAPPESRCRFVWDDGGRAAAGHKGVSGDCVARAIAIATQLDYTAVRDGLDRMAERERPRSRFVEGKGWVTKRRSNHTSNGVHKATIRRYMESIGWQWVPTMQIGSGCKVHLRRDELPAGRIVCNLSKHLAAVVDGELHDLSDCSRLGTRCVYGYYTKGKP